MENKKIVWKVPKGIRYIGNWPEFKFSKLPNRCILNKQIPGCGFTEYCINGPENVILCSPRKILLQNKFDQHKDEVYLVVNGFEKVLNTDKDLNSSFQLQQHPVKVTANNLTKEELESLEEDLKNKKRAVFDKIRLEIEAYINQRACQFKPYKILVTYDSFKIVNSILSQMKLSQSFHVVVDEMQTILHDSRFKSSTEIDFLNQLDNVDRVYFVSATPMLGDYLSMLDEFKDLPYCKLDWKAEDPLRVQKPSLDVRSVSRSITSKAKDVISKYLSGNFEKVYEKRGGVVNQITSTEAVLYVNSVTHITRIIKSTNLKPEQVNILCADTPENRKKLNSSLGKKFVIGRVPLKDEVNKMFTFCTRTVYLGADFYSKCARTFIFSDANIESLSVDISEDLPQILGRQRDLNNPWRNSAEFYFKSLSSSNKIEIDQFEKLIEKKKSKSRLYFTSFDKVDRDEQEALMDSYESMIRDKNYKENYVSVNDINGRRIPVMNNLVLVSEIRAFKIQQIDYKDRFTVFSTISSNELKYDKIIEKLEQDLIDCGTFYEKMKYVCSLSEENYEMLIQYLPNDNDVKYSCSILGRDKCRALSYNKTRITSFISRNYVKDIDINTTNPMESLFEIGGKYPVAEVKKRLIEGHKLLGSNINSINATELGKYFEYRLMKLTVTDPETGKKTRTRGYKILSKK